MMSTSGHLTMVDAKSTHVGGAMAGLPSPAQPTGETQPMMKPAHASGAVGNQDCGDTNNNSRPAQAKLVPAPSDAHILESTQSASEPSEGSQLVTTIVTARYLPIKRLEPVPFGWVPRKSRTIRTCPSTVTWGSQDHAAAMAVARKARQAAARSARDRLKRRKEDGAAPKPKRQQRRRAAPPPVVPATPQHQVGLGNTVWASQQGAAALLAAAAAGAEEDTLMSEEEVMVAAAGLVALGVGAAEAGTEGEQQHQHNIVLVNQQQNQQPAQQAANHQQPQATGVSPQLVAATRSWLVGQGMLREEGGHLDQLSEGLWRQWQKVLQYKHEGRVDEAMWLTSQLGGATAALLPRNKS